MVRGSLKIGYLMGILDIEALWSWEQLSNRIQSSRAVVKKAFKKKCWYRSLTYTKWGAHPTSAEPLSSASLGQSFPTARCAASPNAASHCTSARSHLTLSAALQTSEKQEPVQKASAPLQESSEKSRLKKPVQAKYRNWNDFYTYASSGHTLDLAPQSNIMTRN